MDYEQLMKLLDQIDRVTVKALADEQLAKLLEELETARLFVRVEREQRAGQ